MGIDNSCLNGFIRDMDAVVMLISFLEPLQNSDAICNRWLLNQNLGKAA